MHICRLAKPSQNPASQKLLRLLSEPALPVQQIDACVDELAASSLAFNEELLGGGPWRVRVTPVNLCMLQ